MILNLSRPPTSTIVQDSFHAAKSLQNWLSLAYENYRGPGASSSSPPASTPEPSQQLDFSIDFKRIVLSSDFGSLDGQELQVLVLGYPDGFQLWQIPSTLDQPPLEIYSFRSCSSSSLETPQAHFEREFTSIRIMKSPSTEVCDVFLHARPLLIVSCATDLQKFIQVGRSRLLLNSPRLFSLSTHQFLTDSPDLTSGKYHLFDSSCSRDIFALSLYDSNDGFSIRIYSNSTGKCLRVFHDCCPNPKLGYPLLVVSGILCAYSSVSKLSKENDSNADDVHGARKRQISWVLDRMKDLGSSAYTQGKSWIQQGNYTTSPQPSGNPWSKVALEYLKEIECEPGFITVASFTGPIVSQFRAHIHHVNCITFDSSGTILASASVEGTTVHLWRILPETTPLRDDYSPSNTPVKHLCQLHRGLSPANIEDIQFSSDNQTVAACTRSGTVHVWTKLNIDDQFIGIHPFVDFERSVADYKIRIALPRVTKGRPHGATYSSHSRENSDIDNIVPDGVSMPIQMKSLLEAAKEEVEDEVSLWRPFGRAVVKLEPAQDNEVLVKIVQPRAMHHDYEDISKKMGEAFIENEVLWWLKCSAAEYSLHVLKISEYLPFTERFGIYSEISPQGSSSALTVTETKAFYWTIGRDSFNGKEWPAFQTKFTITSPSSPMKRKSDWKSQCVFESFDPTDATSLLRSDTLSEEARLQIQRENSRAYFEKAQFRFQSIETPAAGVFWGVRSQSILSDTRSVNFTSNFIEKELLEASEYPINSPSSSHSKIE